MGDWARVISAAGVSCYRGFFMKWVTAFYQDIFVRQRKGADSWDHLQDKLTQMERVVMHTQRSTILCERFSRTLQKHCKNIAGHVTFCREEFQQFYLFKGVVGWKTSALCAICCFVFADAPECQT